MDNFIKNYKINNHLNLCNEISKKINDIDKFLKILKDYTNNNLFFEEYNKEIKEIYKNLLTDEEIYFIKLKDKYINLYFELNRIV